MPIGTKAGCLMDLLDYFGRNQPRRDGPRGGPILEMDAEHGSFSISTVYVISTGWLGNTRRFTCKLQLVVSRQGSPRAFQSAGRRERLRGRNLVPEIAMYPAGRPGRTGSVKLPNTSARRAKVIKAFVLPAHRRANLLRQSLAAPRTIARLPARRC